MPVILAITYQKKLGLPNFSSHSCSVSLILRIVNESKMPKEEVEEMAQQLFGIGVKQLDKMQASQIIDELLEKTGKKVRRSNWNGRQTTPAR